ncbi:hypothetical protein WJX75_009119 [Coccomyxa subellipsoidea]|uniref:FAD-binding FR-type domain-containing protein n=1 Tax=Coccomyxa subellipsoidea TaxID=248742 RepID=A0ABR2YID7_9CHLO
MAFSGNATGLDSSVSQVANMDLTSLYEANPYAVVAAVGATAAILPLSTMLLGRTSKPPPPFLTQQWQSLPLVSSQQESHNVQRLTFALLHKQQLLGLPAGQCIKVKATTAKGAELVQAFNPISTDDTPGEVVLLVKAYPEGHPQHDMAKALSSMRKGDKIEIKGPFGSFKYQPGRYKAIGLLAGGMGVTPMINLSHVILKNPNDKVKLRLMFAANSVDDLVLKQHLDSLAAGYYGKFKSFYVVNEAPEEGHHLSLGLLDKEMVAKYLNTPPSDDVLIVLCGPPAFRADMDSVLSKLGYTNVVVIDDM